MYHNLKYDLISRYLMTVLCCLEVHIHSRPSMNYYQPTLAYDIDRCDSFTSNPLTHENLNEDSQYLNLKLDTSVHQSTDRILRFALHSTNPNVM
jgi:hypothetical protein